MPLTLTARKPPPPPLTSSTADFAPLLVGLQITLSVQLPLPTTALPQLSVTLNLLASPPARAMLVLLTVTDLLALDVWIAWLPNAIDLGDRVRASPGMG